MRRLATASIVFYSAKFAMAMLASSSATACCNALSSSSLAGSVYFPDATLYNARLETYWSRSAALAPTCMVLPTSPEDVSQIVRTIVANNCSFGVRGGGHGVSAYSSSVDEGVTIDFGFMNETTYNSDTKIVSVSPGGNWQRVYEALAPHGVTVTGGRAGTVGVGGFVTGGGNNFHAASHGLACDNVRSFEVVLADGTVVDANADQNPDLWRALKGGSGNLGLVTRFDMYAVEFADPNTTDIWGGLVSYDAAAASDAVVDALVAFVDGVESDHNSSCLVLWAYAPELGGTTLMASLDNTANVAYAPAFDGFLSAPGILSTTLRSAPMPELSAELGMAQPYGYRHIWLVGAYKNDARVLRYIVKKHEEILARLAPTFPAESGFNTFCAFQPITQALVRHGAEKGGNVLGLEDRVKNGNGIMFLVGVGVYGAQDEARLWPKWQAWFDDVEDYATSIGSNWDWHYLNYASQGQDAIASYGEESLELIRKAAAKYDPTQVFQRLRKSGFKIPVEASGERYPLYGPAAQNDALDYQSPLG